MNTKKLSKPLFRPNAATSSPNAKNLLGAAVAQWQGTFTEGED
jgi:hypothetical protein